MDPEDVIADQLGLSFASLPWVQPDPEDAEWALFTHVCDGSQFTSMLPAFGTGGWWWEGDALRPSIHCLNCGTHGWWDGPEKGWRVA